ncbi:MAG: hypothetical protein EA371_07425, partial [Gammaproteobacteria bacterium]
MTTISTLAHKSAIGFQRIFRKLMEALGSVSPMPLEAHLTACAARRHAHGINHPPVAVYVDEAAEVINDPLIQLLNKGRSSG